VTRALALGRVGDVDEPLRIVDDLIGKPLDICHGSTS
jgi:hypothetical protein